MPNVMLSITHPCALVSLDMLAIRLLDAFFSKNLSQSLQGLVIPAIHHRVDPMQDAELNMELLFVLVILSTMVTHMKVVDQNV